jgi:hypothetical protein
MLEEELELPPRNVTIREPRRCGFCKEPGHNMSSCDLVYRYTEVLYQTAFAKIQTDVLEKKNGYIFEQWVYELEEEDDLKYLVWKITDTYENTHDNLYCRNIVFEYFANQNIGYISQRVRRTRNYYKVYRVVNLDIVYESRSSELDNFLKNILSENEVDDVYFKICTMNPTNSNNQNEFMQWFQQPALMSYKHFIIHRHFSELGFGYNFQLQNMPGYHDPSSSSSYFRMDINLHTKLLTLSYASIEYTIIIKEGLKEEDSSSCTICMEIKENTNLITTECNHSFCNICTKQMMSRSSNCNFDCPLCRRNVNTLYCDEKIVHTFYSK